MKKFLAVAFSLTMFFGLQNHTEAFAEETYDDMAHLEEECGLEFGGDYESAVRALKDNYESIGIEFEAYDNKSNKYYDKRERRSISRLATLNMLIEYGHRNGRYGKDARYQSRYHNDR